MASPATVSASPSPSYPPAQQRVIELLGRSAGGGGRWPAGFLGDLADGLDEAVSAPAAAIPAGQTLYVGKSALSSIETCEGRWRHSLDTPFRWSVASIRGTVSHKAIELAANWRGEAEPARVVDAAIEHLIDGHTSAGGFLRGLSTVELAELRSQAVARVTAFEECFPPLRSRWRPVLEGRLTADLAGGRVRLIGRPDLTLGSPRRGGKVLVDLKTGHRDETHAADLQFYALLDALRLGVPPRRVATMYLDAGRPDVADVTVDSLLAAADRVATAVADMVALRWGGRPAQLRSGPHCRWCPARDACVAGAEWERGREVELSAA